MRQTKYAVALSEEERAGLRTFVGRGTAPARMLTRARILLKADQGEGGPGWADAAIAGALEVHPATVARVRRQFVEEGRGAALARKRPDRVYERALDGAAEAHLVALTCSPPPAEAKRLAERLEIHYTPKHGSWLNMAEIELSALQRQCLDRRLGDRSAMEREVAAWVEARNAAATSVDWRFTAADARIKLKRLYPAVEP